MNLLQAITALWEGHISLLLDMLIWAPFRGKHGYLLSLRIAKQIHYSPSFSFGSYQTRLALAMGLHFSHQTQEFPECSSRLNDTRTQGGRQCQCRCSVIRDRKGYLLPREIWSYNDPIIHLWVGGGGGEAKSIWVIMPNSLFSQNSPAHALLLDNDSGKPRWLSCLRSTVKHVFHDSVLESCDTDWDWNLGQCVP